MVSPARAPGMIACVERKVHRVSVWTSSSLTELGLLLVAFVLCSFIGIERQFRQKSAGFRTHVLVGCGSAVFTLVSAFGFSAVLGDDVNLDPSRIAAQIVSGIGFLGAGVIFTRRNIVVGLTTAASIWVTAAVGMAAGAGMITLAAGLTAIHLISVILLAPLVRRIPTQDRRKVLRVSYLDGRGALRTILSTATEMGYTASILSTRKERHDDRTTIQMDIRFDGSHPTRNLVPALADQHDIESVYFRDQESDE